MGSLGGHGGRRTQPAFRHRLSASLSIEACRLEAREEAKASSPSLLAKGGLRLIQVQPTLNCNLRCRHCYSESGPGKVGALSGERLGAFLGEARGLGYGYVGVSGGEPLVWADLDRFLGMARELGYSTAVVTNGTLLTPARAQALKQRAGVVAVSVDGPPEEHAAMRGSDTAFPRMVQGLSVLRSEGVPFVLVFTLSRTNADRLSWVYAFAEEVGARAVEVHPLCNFGAAAVNLADAIPDSQEFRVAGWLLALLSAERAEKAPGVVIDVYRRAIVEASAWPLLPGRNRAGDAVGFADLVPSLIVEPDGAVVPFIYGFPREWAVGRVGDGPLVEAAERWRAGCVERVAALVAATLERLGAAEEDYIDLFGQLLATAHQQPARR